MSLTIIGGIDVNTTYTDAQSWDATSLDVLTNEELVKILTSSPQDLIITEDITHNLEWQLIESSIALIECHGLERVNIYGDKILRKWTQLQDKPYIHVSQSS